MLNPEQKDALLTTRLCQFIDANELDILLDHSSVVLFSTNEIILKQGKKTPGLYIIIEGTALVTAKVLGEGIIKLDTLKHGNFIGEISLLENGPCATSVIATSPMQCLFIKTDLFNSLLIFFPQIKYQIMKAITYEVCDRLQNMHKKIIESMSESDMTTQTFFSALIKSFSHSQKISFEYAGIDKEKLKKIDLFNSFTSEEYDELMNYTSLLSSPKNDVIIDESQQNSACYIVLQGAVRANIMHENKVAKLCVLGPIKLFCGISTFDNTLPPIIHYTACEQAILLKISTSDLMIIQNNNIHLWYKIFDLMCKSFVFLERYADKLDIRLHSELYNR